MPYITPSASASVVSNTVTPASVANFAAATQGLQIKTGAGVLRRVVVTIIMAGTGPYTFFDGTTTSGTVLGSTGLTTAAGTILTFDMPFATGLFVDKGTSGTGTIAIAYD